jgi:hypothetical protein
MDKNPLCRTLAEAENFEREQRIAERRRLIALGVRRGWISFPSADAPCQNQTHEHREANPV